MNPNILHPKITKNTQKLQQIAPKSAKNAFFTFNLENFTLDTGRTEKARAAGDQSALNVKVLVEKYLKRLEEDNRVVLNECCNDVVLIAGWYHEEQPCHVNGEHSDQEPGWDVDPAVVAANRIATFFVQIITSAIRFASNISPS